MRRYLQHFNTKFKYAIIGWYIGILAMVTYTVVYDGILWGLLLYLILEGVFGIIIFFTYVIEKHIINTYK